MDTWGMLLGAGLSGAGLYWAARATSSQRGVNYASILFAVGVAILGFMASKPIGSYFGLLGLSAASGLAVFAIWMSNVANHSRSAVLFWCAGAVATAGLLCAAQQWIAGTLLILVSGLAFGKSRWIVGHASVMPVREPFLIGLVWCCWVVSATTVVNRSPASWQPTATQPSGLTAAIDGVVAVDATVWLLLAAAVAMAALCRSRDVV